MPKLIKRLYQNKVYAVHEKAYHKVSSKQNFAFKGGATQVYLDVHCFLWPVNYGIGPLFHILECKLFQNAYTILYRKQSHLHVNNSNSECTYILILK